MKFHDNQGILTERNYQETINKELELKNRIVSKNSRENYIMNKRRDRNFERNKSEGKNKIESNEIEARINSAKVDLLSNFIQNKINGAIEIRKLLSIELNPPIDEVISSGILPSITELLNSNVDSRLQFEAAWIVTNIASGNSNQTKTIVNLDVIPSLVSLINISNDDVKEQCVWALGNISGDSVRFRDEVLKNGALVKLLSCIVDGKKDIFSKECNLERL